MNTSSPTYNRYSNPDSFEQRDLFDIVQDLEKTLNSLQDKYIHLKEHIEAIDTRTKIIIYHYNIDMSKEERDFE